VTITARTIRSLEMLLVKECRLYEQYLTVLLEERTSIIRFNAETLGQLTVKRAALYEEMLKAQDTRLELMRSFPSNQGKKLRDLITQYCTPEDKRRLLPLAEKLKSLVESVQQQSKEQNQILGFGLKLVHGMVSLFWSATQNVVRSYSRKGVTKEAYNPASRNSNVLKRV
jgi:hypothetical protein